MAYAAVVTVPIKSIFGKLVGLDRPLSSANNQERLYALYGVRDNLTSITTGSTNVTNHGVALVTSSSGAWTMDAPSIGVEKRLFATSSSTLVRTFALASGNYEVGASVGGGSGTVTAGSSYVVITLNGEGQAVTLVGISTAKFAVMSAVGFSTAATIFSTV